MKTLSLLATLSLCTVLSACGGRDADNPADGATGPAPTAAAEPSEAGSPPGESGTAGSDPAAPDCGAEPSAGSGPRTTVPPFPAGTAGQSGEDGGAPNLDLVDVRVAEHDGFARIVVELAGDGTPGWSAGYVDRAVADGSGEAVRLPGDSVLDVYARGVVLPDAEGPVPPGLRLEPDAADPVEAVHVVGVREGDLQLLVGVDGEAAPFRSYVLTDPARLVVDVRDVDD